MKSRPTPLLNLAFIALAFVASSIVTGCEQSETQSKTERPETSSAPEADPAAQKPSDASCGGGGGS